MSEDDMERSAIIQNTEHWVSSPESNLYFSLVRQSEQTLIKAAATGSARNFLTQAADDRPGMLFSEMLSAYEDGRNARLNADNTQSFAR
jgi:hypothetical protein